MLALTVDEWGVEFREQGLTLTCTYQGRGTHPISVAPRCRYLALSLGIAVEQQSSAMP